MFMHWYLATLIVSFLGFVVTIHDIDRKIKKDYIVLSRTTFSEFLEMFLIVLAMSMVPFVNLMIMLLAYSRADETRDRTVERMLKKGTLVPKDL